MNDQHYAQLKNLAHHLADDIRVSDGEGGIVTLPAHPNDLRKARNIYHVLGLRDSEKRIEKKLTKKG